MQAAASTWARLRRHAVFPLLVYLVLTQVLRESYPFSHYPMYSRPTSRPLKFQFLADGAGAPLPVAWHTGITPSKVGKMYGDRKEKFETEREAALDVLAYLRKQNSRRKGRALPERIQLFETEIGLKAGGFSESNRLLAEHQVQPSP
jgi:hypothetical protein